MCKQKRIKQYQSTEDSVRQQVKVIMRLKCFGGKLYSKQVVNILQCLEKLFGVNDPQNLEKEESSVYHKQVYENDAQPKLIKVQTGLNYTY